LTRDLTSSEVAAIRALMDVAFGSVEEEHLTDDDWDHAIGGVHFVLDLHGAPITHASVVERELEVDGRPLRTGYVEAVATAPDEVSDQPGRYGWNGGYGTFWFNDPSRDLIAIAMTQVSDILFNGTTTEFAKLAMTS